MTNVTQGNFEVVNDEPEVIPPLPPDDSIQAFVHHKRVQLVKEMLTPEGKMPQDPKDRVVMLAALKDMDSSALNRQRLAIENKQADAQGATHSLIAKLLTAMPNKMSRSDVEATPREAPKLGADFPTPELLEGETATTLPQQDYATFMSKYLQGGDSKTS